MRRSRGSILIGSLLLTLILLVTGLGLMTAQVSRYAAAAQVVEAAQARNAALSGMEDVRVKIAKDVKFPPRKSRERGQSKFAYSESLVLDPDRPLGYTVVIDYGLEREVQVTNRWEPYRWGVYRISVTGFVGPRIDPLAKRAFYAEYDIETGQFIRFEDKGSL